MKQINLKTNEFNKRKTKNKSSLSLTLGIIFLTISIIAYGAIYFYRSQISNKISVVDDEVAAKQIELNSEEFKKIYDFEKRLTEIQSKLDVNIKQSQNLINISKATFQETYFKNIDAVADLGRSEFVIEVNVPDFDFLAKQIAAFNKMEKLDGGVRLEESAAKEVGVDAKIKFAFLASEGSQEDASKSVDN